MIPAVVFIEARVSVVRLDLLGAVRTEFHLSLLLECASGKVTGGAGQVHYRPACSALPAQVEANRAWTWR